MNEEQACKQLGQILKQIRIKAKLSQVDTAIMAGLSIRHYQEIEYGKIKCQINTLSKILSVYNFNIYTFFTDFILEHFYDDGVDFLYAVFGTEYFGYRRFDFHGTATYQCYYSELITGMKRDEVVGKIKMWHDLEDEMTKKFIELSYNSFVNLLPKHISWKLNIKNHLTNKFQPYMGYVRFEKNEKGEKCEIGAIIFPILSPI